MTRALNTINLYSYKHAHTQKAYFFLLFKDGPGCWEVKLVAALKPPKGLVVAAAAPPKGAAPPPKPKGLAAVFAGAPNPPVVAPKAPVVAAEVPVVAAAPPNPNPPKGAAAARAVVAAGAAGKPKAGFVAGAVAGLAPNKLKEGAGAAGAPGAAAPAAAGAAAVAAGAPAPPAPAAGASVEGAAAGGVGLMAALSLPLFASSLICSALSTRFA